MKKLSLIAMFLSLGFFAIGCETETEDAADAQIEASEEHAEAEAATDAAAAGEIEADEAAEEVEDANEAAVDAAETNAEAVEDGNAPATPQ